MVSLNDLFRHLPREFVDRLYRDFPAAVAERILQGMAAPRPVTLRVNRLRAAPAAVREELREQGVQTESVPWYEDALRVVTPGVRERRMAELPAFRDGRLYLQSLASMLPPLVLDPQPGERVLDLAAAPGSKTTQMAAMMGNEGFILACEKNPIRLGRLEHNLKVQGVTIAQAVRADGATIGRRHPGEFDRALLDAPCSGEGLFLYGVPASYRYWTAGGVERMAALQRRLLASAWQALRVGGVLVYSTCTIARAENEDVVAWALSRWGDKVELEPCRLPAASPGGFEPGGPLLLDLLEEAVPAGTGGGAGAYPAAVQNAVRILPSPDMEGFFIARLRKRG